MAADCLIKSWIFFTLCRCASNLWSHLLQMRGPPLSTLLLLLFLTFSPLISFRCSWRLRLTSRMRFPWSRITLILSASDRLSRRTSSSLVHLSSSSSVRPEMSSAGLSLFAMDSWRLGCGWGWSGGVAFSIGTAPPAPTKGRKHSRVRQAAPLASNRPAEVEEAGYRLVISGIVRPLCCPPLSHSLIEQQLTMPGWVQHGGEDAVDSLSLHHPTLCSGCTAWSRSGRRWKWKKVYLDVKAVRDREEGFICAKQRQGEEKALPFSPPLCLSLLKLSPPPEVCASVNTQLSYSAT